jgi:Domain of unknown function (DUF4157)
MHERELERRSRDHDDATLDVSAPGRANTTAGLSRREQSSASGILMRKGEGAAVDADAALDLAAGSSGTALPDQLRERFEGSLGTDLSSVRVHTGGESELAASAVSAQAFAVGQDVHFGANQYDPTSDAGQHLIAHEVAHTVQQRGGSAVRQNKLTVSSSGDALEVEADRAADAMVAGRPASVSGGGLAIARNPGSQHAPPPPPGMITLKNLSPVSAAVKAGEAEGTGSIPSPAGLYDVAETNYKNRANHCTNVQAHYTASGKGVELPKIGEIGANHNFQAFAKTAGEANKYCESGAVLANAASTAIAMWVPLLQSSQNCWADVKTAAAKANIDTVADKDGSTSLEDEGVTEEGQQLKGYDRLVNDKKVATPGADASAKAKADAKRQQESTDKDNLDGKNVDPQAKSNLMTATSVFDLQMTAVTDSRKQVMIKHGTARKSLLDAKSKANAKRQSSSEDELKGVNEILGAVDKAYAGIETARGVIGGTAAFMEGSGTSAEQKKQAEGVEKSAEDGVKGITPGAVAKAILQIDGTIPKIEGEIAACKTRDENLKGIIDEGAIQSAGAALVEELRKYKTALEKMKTAVTNYDAAHKAYATAMNAALMKRGVIKPGEDGVKPIMDVLAKVQIAKASTSAAVAATADVAAAVAALNGLGAAPQPDVCQLAAMVAAHAKAFGTAPSHVTQISGVLGKRTAKLASYVEKLGI